MGTKSKKILSVSATVFALTIVSKALGFLREILMGYFIGTSSITDAYNISNVIPNFFMLIVQQVISIALIPIFLRIFYKKDEKQANSFISNTVFIIGILSFLFSAFVFLFSKQLVFFFASGMTDPTKELSSSMLKMSSWSLFLQSFVLIMSSYLQAKKRFVIIVVAGYSIDISAVLFFVITSKVGNYYLLGLIPVLTMLLQLLVIVPASVKNGFSLRIKRPLFTSEVKELFKVSIPALFSVGIYQINLLVDKNVASLISEGGISSLSYAQTLVNIFETLIMNSIVTIAYSSFSSYISKNEEENAKSLFYKSANKIAIFTIPVSFALFAFSEYVVRAIYQRGAFDEMSVALTSANLRGYSIALFPLCMTFLYTRYLYSKSNRIVPIIFSSITLFTNVFLNFASYKFTTIGISGVAWATSAANFLNFAMMAFYCSKKLKLKFSCIINKQVVFLTTSSSIFIVASFLLFNLISRFINSIYINGILVAMFYFGCLFFAFYLTKRESVKMFIRNLKEKK